MQPVGSRPLRSNSQKCIAAFTYDARGSSVKAHEDVANGVIPVELVEMYTSIREWCARKFSWGLWGRRQWGHIVLSIRSVRLRIWMFRLLHCRSQPCTQKKAEQLLQLLDCASMTRMYSGGVTADQPRYKNPKVPKLQKFQKLQNMNYVTYT